MFNYHPSQPQYNHVKCPYHRIFHTIKNTEYGGHEECISVGQCVSPVQCALYQTCPTHELFYEDDTPTYNQSSHSFYYIPPNFSPEEHFSHNTIPHNNPHNIPRNIPCVIPHNVHNVVPRAVPQAVPYNIPVKRSEKKKKSKKSECQCACSKVCDKKSNAPSVASTPTLPNPFIASSDLTYYWIVHLLGYMEVNTTEQNEKFAKAICEFFKLSVPTQPSISSILQEIAEKTKVSTNIPTNIPTNGPKGEIKVEATNESKPESHPTDVWVDIVNTIGDKSDDPRIKQFTNIFTDTIKLSQNPDQSNISKTLTDLFIKNMNDFCKNKGVNIGITETEKQEIKPTETPSDTSILNSIKENPITKQMANVDSVTEADKILKEYIEKSDPSILDSMNEARITKALEDMD